MAVTYRYYSVDDAVREDSDLAASRARGIMSRIDDSFPWPADDGGSARIAWYRYELEEALDIHGLLRTGGLHPMSEFPELEDQTWALEIALMMVTEDIRDGGEALVSAVRNYCGEEVAAYVSGGQGAEVSTGSGPAKCRSVAARAEREGA